MSLNNSINAPLPISAANGGTGNNSNTQFGVLIGQGSNPITSTVLGSGQVLIGTTSSNPVATTLTAGNNISITNGSGSISIASTVPTISGTYSTTTPTITASTGWTGLTVSNSIIQRIGNTVLINATLAGTTTSTTHTITITAPNMISNFVNGLQATGNGTLFRTAGATASNMGFVTSVVSVAGTQSILLSSVSQTPNTAHTITINFAYIIQ